MNPYLRTLIDYAAIAVALAATMLFSFRLLLRLRVRREAATGFVLIMPWLLGFLIWTVYP